MNYKKNILLFIIFSYFFLGLFLSINTGISHDEFHEQLNWSKNFDAIKSFFGEGLVDQLVEVRADAVTQNQDGTYSLRFPRFKTFRGFEIGEKI